MINIETDGITQKTMALLANVSPSAVSRFITSNHISSIESGGQRNLRYPIKDVRNIVKSLIDSNKTIIKKRHVFYNFKGGTGKTSICYQVSSHVALMGYRVLVVDADPQAHLSTSFGILNDTDNLTLYDCIIGKQNPRNVIKEIYPGLDCIPSNLSLTRLEVDLNNMPKREERLSIELAQIEDDYDFIFIDTNPTISILNRNIVTYSDYINIVCETQPYSVNGLKLLMEDLDQFFFHMQMNKPSITMIPNKYEDRTASSAESMTALKTYYSKYIKENFAIRKSEDIVTSSKLGKPLAFFVKKNSIALEDVMELVHDVVKSSF
jgi:chromosome partitioning protein